MNQFRTIAPHSGSPGIKTQDTGLSPVFQNGSWPIPGHNHKAGYESYLHILINHHLMLHILELLTASLNKPWPTGNELMTDTAFAEIPVLRSTS